MRLIGGSPLKGEPGAAGLPGEPGHPGLPGMKGSQVLSAPPAADVSQLIQQTLCFLSLCLCLIIYSEKQICIKVAVKFSVKQTVASAQSHCLGGGTFLEPDSCCEIY